MSSRREARKAQREGKKEARRQHYGGSGSGDVEGAGDGDLVRRVGKGNGSGEDRSGGRPQLKVIGKGQSSFAGLRGSKIRREKEEARRREMAVALAERERIEREEVREEDMNDRTSAKRTKRKVTAHPVEEGDEEKKGKKKRKSVTFANADKEGFTEAEIFRKKEEEEVGRQQRKHVGQGVMTPLERMLIRSGQRAGSNVDRAEVDETRAEKEDKRRKRRKRTLTSAEKSEEDEIAWLEAKLGLRGGKIKNNKAKASAVNRDDDEGAVNNDDGLDDFLDELDRFYPGMYSGSSEDGSNDEDQYGNGDDEDDNGDEEDDNDDDDDDDDEINSEEDEDDDGESDEDEEEEDDNIISSNEEDAEMASESEAASEDRAPDEGEADVQSNRMGTHDSSDEQEVTAPKSSSKKQKQEMKAQDTVIPEHQPAVGRYVPPALRKAAEAAASVETSEPSVEQQKLRRQLKGLLNRLGDANIDTILGEIECVYGQSSRAQVTTCLTDLIIETIASSANLIDTFVILYAALTSSLHRIVGLEFGAHFVQTLVEKWLKHVERARENANKSVLEEEGKECINLLVLLGHLYNLSVVACPLVYDIVRFILGVKQDGTKPDGRMPDGRMQEVDVEMLLKLMRVCGPQLRHDDPSSLRSIIHLAQERSCTDAATTSSRARFMIEALQDLKNNRTKATANDVSAQSIVRMKKFLTSLSKKRTVRTQEPLRVTLDDLREVEKKGRWWLVGAAWAGHQRDEESGLGSNVDRTKLQTKGSNKAKDRKEDEEIEALLALAKRQGMNTDARRSIFLVLLQSQDYLDASRRLLSLRLNETQRRETVRVLLHCIGAEKSFNPYYALVGQQLAVDDGGAKFTMQYCLWDFLRSLGQKECGGKSFSVDDNDDGDEEDGHGFDQGERSEQSATKVQNVARAYAWWLAKGSLSLYALKVSLYLRLSPS